MNWQDVKLMIATPFYEIKAYVPYIISLFNSLPVLNHLGVAVKWEQICGDSYVDRVKNTICARFLESDCTDLMMIDSDMEWDMEAIGRMVMAPYEVVGADYPLKNNWECYGSRIMCNPDGTPEVDQVTGLIRAEWVPGGFLRLKRSCLEKMRDAYSGNGYYDPSADTPPNQNRFYTPFFECKIEGQRRWGEDVMFCRKWQAIGGEIWLEPRITFSHYGVKGWPGNLHEFLLRQEGGSEAPMDMQFNPLGGTL